jgi:trigger factor
MQPSVELEEGGPGQGRGRQGRARDAARRARAEDRRAEARAADGRADRRAEVDAALARLAEGQKSFEARPASHKAAKGDLVVIDYEGKVDGEPFEGGKGEGMSVELGSGRLIPGFEDQLVGAKANEQRTSSHLPGRIIRSPI